MIKLKLTRLRTSDQGTFGVLVLPDKTVLSTGELPWRDNKPDFSCIPQGTYDGILMPSPRFQTNLIKLQKVPKRENVLIHRGNYCGDTTKGFKSDVEGCILLGLNTGMLENQEAVLGSTSAIAKFYTLIGLSPIMLTIENLYDYEECEPDIPADRSKPLV